MIIESYSATEIVNGFNLVYDRLLFLRRRISVLVGEKYSLTPEETTQVGNDDIFIGGRIRLGQTLEELGSTDIITQLKLRSVPGSYMSLFLDVLDKTKTSVSQIIVATGFASLALLHLEKEVPIDPSDPCITEIVEEIHVFKSLCDSTSENALDKICQKCSDMMHIKKDPYGLWRSLLHELSTPDSTGTLSNEGIRRVLSDFKNSRLPMITIE